MSDLREVNAKMPREMSSTPESKKSTQQSQEFEATKPFSLKPSRKMPTKNYAKLKNKLQ